MPRRNFPGSSPGAPTVAEYFAAFGAGHVMAVVVYRLRDHPRLRRSARRIHTSWCGADGKRVHVDARQCLGSSCSASHVDEMSSDKIAIERVGWVNAGLAAVDGGECDGKTNTRRDVISRGTFDFRLTLPSTLPRTARYTPRITLPLAPHHRTHGAPRATPHTHNGAKTAHERPWTYRHTDAARLLNDTTREHRDGLLGGAGGGGILVLDGGDDIHAREDLAEDDVHAVELGRASAGGIKSNGKKGKVGEG
ncbi:hypothetical protein K438DRAFT_1772151 [Mycena galopus ATCC 62051]|nr:hypothetical protein K438DRAFT_1772151 [Mycena galopus ATCC 62051]